MIADLLATIDAWDRAAVDWLQNTIHHPWMTAVMEVVTSRDYWVVPLLLISIFLFIRGGRLRAAAVLVLPLVLFSDAITARVLKPIFGRPRPLDPDSFSFPSVHATNAFAIAALLGYFIRKAWFWILAIFLAGVVAFSRVYLIKHYPTDVIAGALLGSAYAVIFISLYLLLRSYLEQKAPLLFPLVDSTPRD